MGIKDFFANRAYKHDIEVDKEYQKRCEAKIKKLCGGFTANDAFEKRVDKFKTVESYSNTYEKHILKYECKYGRLKFDQIEDRLDELIQLDAETLSHIMADEDSSKFKTQKDIEDYMGEGYVSKFRGKVKNNYRNHILEKAKTSDSTKEKRIEEQRKRREKQKSENEKIKEKRKAEFRQRVKQKEEAKKLKRQAEKSTKNEPIPREKSEKIVKNTYEIEVFKKVKSNTALASAALFLATGVLLAEAKEEMKWVKTQLFIKDDGIKIRNPSLSHKFSDFRYFKVNQEDEYYLFFIGFDDENLIHFRTKEKYLHEVIMEKIQETNLQYESVL